MGVNIRTYPTFDRVAKKMSKKYHSFKQDYANLLQELKDNPNLGTDLGGGFRKIRMQISSKGKGKSGGARVISYNVIANIQDTDVNLLFIYDKAERSTISQNKLNELLKQNEL